MRLVCVLLSAFQTVTAFTPVQTVTHLKNYSNIPFDESNSSVNLSAIDPRFPELQSTLMIAEVEEWRQYVPLIGELCNKYTHVNINMIVKFTHIF